MTIQSLLAVALISSSLTFLSACQRDKFQPLPPPRTSGPLATIKVENADIKDLEIIFPDTGGAITDAPTGTYMLTSVHTYIHDTITGARAGVFLDLEFPGVFGSGSQAKKGVDWSGRKQDFVSNFSVPVQLNVISKATKDSQGEFKFDRSLAYQHSLNQAGETNVDFSTKFTTHTRDLYWIFEDRHAFPENKPERITHYRFDGGSYKINATAAVHKDQLEVYIWWFENNEVLVLRAVYTPTLLSRAM